MFDFALYEERAKRMTVAELTFAIRDAANAALTLDPTDRIHGTDRASRYRDEAFVYRQELNRR